MKKNLIFILLLIFIVLPVFTQENETYNWLYGEENNNFKNGITIGGFGTVSPPGVQGVGIEFGFGLLQEDNFYMRNHLEINASYAGTVASFFGIRERLIIGGHFDTNSNVAIRVYGIFELGFLLFRISHPKTDIYDDNNSITTVSAVEKGAFEGSFIIEPRGGFGTEIVFNNSGSIFIEFLGGEQILSNGTSFYETYSEQLRGTHPSIYTYISINVGARWYIN